MNLLVKNLLSYDSLEHDFDQFGLCSVVGPNGSGKTNFLELLGLVLYGKLSKKPPKDQIASFGVKGGGCGQVSWSTPSGDSITVVRKFEPKESLQVIVNAVDKRFARLEDAQAFVNGLLGTYDIYLATVLYAQEQTEFFVSADEASKKGLLETILKFERYTRAQSRAKATRDSVQLALMDKRSKVSILESTLTFVEDELKATSVKHAEWEATAQGERERLQTEFDALTVTNVLPLEAKVIKREQAVKACENAFPDDVDIEGLEDAVQISEARQTRAQREYDEAVEASTKKAVCPTCERPWDDKKRQAEHTQKALLRVKEYKAYLDEANEAVVRAKAALKEGRELVRPEQVKKAQQALAEARAAYDAAVQARADANAHNRTVEEQRRQVYARLQGYGKNPHTDALARLRAKIKEGRMALILATDEAARLQDDLAYYEFWVTGFGNQGVKSLLLDMHAEYINSRIGYYLDRVTGGGVTAVFNTQKELKSKDLRDKISFNIAVDGQWQDYKAISGGQKTIVNMAVMFAIRDLASKEHRLIPIMLLDETFRELDEAYSGAVLQLLQELSVGTHIYVVSHSEVLRDWTPNAILVSKQNGVSRVEVA